MIISIDKYIFKVTNNISGLSKILSVNLEKTQTISRPFYSHIGGYEQTLSFEAKILLPDLIDFIGFEELVKEARVVKISSFDLCFNKDFFITEVVTSIDTFIKSEFNGVMYYTKTLNISGVILNG
jgi:hypothetical protein|nr:MAG TPA: hypothetical protein [Caudoviricetes sp.]DAO44669.1 MAG TPA: hypothetical protein [Caudoviricetes sp.]